MSSLSSSSSLWGIKGVEGQNPQEVFTSNVERKVVVQEGSCVLVPCNFSYLKKRLTDWTDSDPVHGFWYREGTDRRKDSIVATNNPIRKAVKETRNRFFSLGDPWRNDCSSNIREIRKKDAGLYFFRSERGKTKYNYMWDKMTSVVTALTNTPQILLPETLEAGHPSNSTCSVPWDCGWTAPPIFSWTGTSVSFLSTNTTGSSVLTITPQPQDHGTNLTCQVTSPGTNVSTRMTIRLNVSYAPKNSTVTIYQGADSVSTISKNGSSLPISEGQSSRLICSTDSYPPANLSWSWDNSTSCPSKLSKPGLSESFPVHLKHGGVYTCQAQHASGSQHISLSSSPQSSATLSEMMMGTFVGSGVTALLFSSVCILLSAWWESLSNTGASVTGASATLTTCHRLNCKQRVGESANRTPSCYTERLLGVLTPRVRSYRRKPARPAVVAPHPDALKVSVSQNPSVESQADDSSEPSPSILEAAPSSTEEEIHYATLSFHEMKPMNSWGQQDTTTEYSEIKFPQRTAWP